MRDPYTEESCRAVLRRDPQASRNLSAWPKSKSRKREHDRMRATEFIERQNTGSGSSGSRSESQRVGQSSPHSAAASTRQHSFHNYYSSARSSKTDSCAGSSISTATVSPMTFTLRRPPSADRLMQTRRQMHSTLAIDVLPGGVLKSGTAKKNCVYVEHSPHESPDGRVKAEPNFLGQHGSYRSMLNSYDVSTFRTRFSTDHRGVRIMDPITMTNPSLCKTLHSDLLFSYMP